MIDSRLLAEINRGLAWINWEVGTILRRDLGERAAYVQFRVHWISKPRGPHPEDWTPDGPVWLIKFGVVENECEGYWGRDPAVAVTAFESAVIAGWNGRRFLDASERSETT